MTKFKPGDRIRRVGDSWGDVVKGATYTVSRVRYTGGLALEGLAPTIYSPTKFELLPAVDALPAKVAQELDPNGLSLNQAGAKADAGKLLPRLVLGEFARALTEVVRIGTFGARKYSPRGWLSVPNGRERYAEAADRHQLEVNKGNLIDDGEGGTGGLHKAQVIWNLLAELELELREAERD